MSNFPFNETKTISFNLSKEYLIPDGVIKNPLFFLTDILPDLNADNFLLFNILAYFIISFLVFISSPIYHLKSLHAYILFYTTNNSKNFLYNNFDGNLLHHKIVQIFSHMLQFFFENFFLTS